MASADQALVPRPTARRPPGEPPVAAPFGLTRALGGGDGAGINMAEIGRVWRAPGARAYRVGVRGRVGSDGEGDHLPSLSTETIAVGVAGADKVSPLGNTVGSALPVIRAREFEEHAVTFRSSATLLIYRDGMTEAFDVDGAEFTKARLIAALEAVPGMGTDELPSHMIKLINTFECGTGRADDITFVAVHRGRGLPESAISGLK